MDNAQFDRYYPLLTAAGYMAMRLDRVVLMVSETPELHVHSPENAEVRHRIGTRDASLARWVMHLLENAIRVNQGGTAYYHFVVIQPGTPVDGEAVYDVISQFELPRNGHSG
jgi:hypothetical protein